MRRPQGAACDIGALEHTAAILRPRITGFTPAKGPVGIAVTINGTAFSWARSVTFNGTPATFTVNTAVQITATVPASATSGPIAVTTPGGMATSAASFIVAPRISGFTPSSGVIGASVTINGANFTGATSVTFGGTPATTFTVDTPTRITGTVPAGATAGKVAVSTTAGTTTSAGTFLVKPTVVSVTPGSGPAGAGVTITGTGLTGTSAKTGRISVTTPGGTATSPASFTVQ